MMKKALLGLVCGAAWMVVGCGGVAVNTSAPQSPADTALAAGNIGTVNVSINTSMNADRLALLQKNEVDRLMKESLTASLGAAGKFGGGPLSLDLLIEDFAVPGWGPAWVNVVATLKDGSGAVVKEFSNKSSSMRGGSTASRMTRILSDAGQKVLNRL